MKKLNDQIIIGVDHGYGNIKTANHCFKTGILGYDSEPLFTGDMSIQPGEMELTRTFPAKLTARAWVRAEMPPLAAV